MAGNTLALLADRSLLARRTDGDRINNNATQEQVALFSFNRACGFQLRLRPVRSNVRPYYAFIVLGKGQRVLRLPISE
jgi:hypothetical protein